MARCLGDNMSANHHQIYLSSARRISSGPFKVAASGVCPLMCLARAREPVLSLLQVDRFISSYLVRSGTFLAKIHEEVLTINLNLLFARISALVDRLGTSTSL